MSAPSSSPEPPQPPATPLPPMPGSLVIRVFGGLIRVATLGGAIVGIGALGSIGLSFTGRLPQTAASAIQQWCLQAGITGAAVAMFAGAARAGAIDHRRRILRERSRIEAERAHYAAWVAREAAREVAAREAAIAAERLAAMAAATAAAAERAAASQPATTTAQTPEEIEALIARAKADREKREELERIDNAIRTGTRAA